MATHSLFLPGRSLGQRSLAGDNTGSQKSQIQLSNQNKQQIAEANTTL